MFPRSTPQLHEKRKVLEEPHWHIKETKGKWLDGEDEGKMGNTEEIMKGHQHGEEKQRKREREKWSWPKS